MFLDDIQLVEEAIAHYGLLLPLLDAGGLKAKDLTVADYDITIRTGRQRDRYLHLTEDPFVKVAGGPYTILNPQYGDPTIEELSTTRAEAFGTIVCLSVLEHVVNPFEVFAAFNRLLQPRGLLIVSTVFSFPRHDARDYWRYTPECLAMLAQTAGLQVLESGWRLQIDAGQGVKEIHTGRPQEIYSVYLAARKP